MSMLAITTTDAGNLPLFLLLNIALIVTAWRGDMPSGFYFGSAVFNLLAMFRMKRFFWWWNCPGTLRSARLLLTGFSAAWVAVALARVVFYKTPFL
jgi:hypothetical protein